MKKVKKVFGADFGMVLEFWAFWVIEAEKFNAEFAEGEGGEGGGLRMARKARIKKERGEDRCSAWRDGRNKTNFALQLTLTLHEAWAEISENKRRTKPDYDQGSSNGAVSGA